MGINTDREIVNLMNMAYRFKHEGKKILGRKWDKNTKRDQFVYWSGFYEAIGKILAIISNRTDKKGDE